MKKEIRNWIGLVVAITCLTSPDPLLLQVLGMKELEQPQRFAVKSLIILISHVYWGAVNLVLGADIVSLGFVSKLAPSFKFELTQLTFLFNEYYHKQFHPLNTVYLDEHSLFASKLEIISEDHAWTEGPVWDEVGQALYFSDVFDDMIFKWTQQGGTEVFLTLSGGQSGGGDGVPDEFYEMIKMPGSNGLAIQDRHLYICQHLLGRIARINLDIVTPGRDLSDYEGKGMDFIDEHPLIVKKFNSPNDLVFDSQGTIWFTDPTYGHHKKDQFVEGPGDEILQCSVCADPAVYIIYENGETAYAIEGVDHQLGQPNGIGFSPDEKYLYVSDTSVDQYRINVYKDPLTQGLPLDLYKVLDQTNLGGSFFLADGFQVDENGLIWTSSLMGITVIDPEAEKYVAKIHTGVAISNIAFGKDNDVFITGAGHVWKIKRNSVLINH